jgi:hypothetical protein
MTLTEDEKKMPICFDCFEALGLEKQGFIDVEDRWRGRCGFCDMEKSVFPVSEATNI